MAAKKTASKPKAAPRKSSGGLPTDPKHPLYSPLTVDGNKK